MTVEIKLNNKYVAILKDTECYLLSPWYYFEPLVLFHINGIKTSSYL